MLNMVSTSNRLTDQTASARGIRERRENGLIVLSPAQGKPYRRVLYVNSYGGQSIWDRIKNRSLPQHHLWGCLELARMGYEVALAEPLPDFYLYRNPFPHDLKLLNWSRSWLGRDGIVYCAHNVLYWIPFLRRLKLLGPRIVSLLFAREPLDHAVAHSAILALTPAAEEQAKKLAPKVLVKHLGWGTDVSFFPSLPYEPEWFLSCGKTHRDHSTLSQAASLTTANIRVICPTLPMQLRWSSNVLLRTGGECDDTVTYDALLNDHYARCVASLIVLKHDPTEYTAVGFTNLIEAMAMGRPVIVTRTGALPTEIDVERAGCGIHVPPSDPKALANAIEQMITNPTKARAMGEKGRQLCETRYNITRYTTELHEVFERLG
jgi:hypothetical protein